MIDWTATQEALKAAIVSMTDGYDVEYRDDAQPFISDESQGRIYLSVGRVARVGVDDRVFEKTEGGGFREVVKGQRTFVLNVQADSYTQSPDETAKALLEKIRIRFMGSSIRATLAAAGVSVARAGSEFTDLPTVRDERSISSGSIDVLCGVSFEVVVDETADYFDHVEISSDLKGTDGQPLGKPPNFDNETIGPAPVAP